MYHKRTETNTGVMNIEQQDTLIFTRQIGHQAEMPGSGQWKIIT
jgi:hypothetical protein